MQIKQFKKVDFCVHRIVLGEIEKNNGKIYTVFDNWDYIYEMELDKYHAYILLPWRKRKNSLWTKGPREMFIEGELSWNLREKKFQKGFLCTRGRSCAKY